MIQTVLSAYGLKKEDTSVELFGTGLINATWRVVSAGQTYILQCVNHTVFTQPQDIADNTRLIADHLATHHPEYMFAAPVITTAGREMVFMEEEGYFRLFPFVSGSHSKDVVETPEQAYEAAAQFGKFTRLLSGIDLSGFKITIPSFHDLSLRYQQFLSAVINGNKERICLSQELIKKVSNHADIVKIYEQLKTDPGFRLRITHHDTKISNVLFDKNNKGICVIDLDTVMPGYFMSDAGDMMRTYLSPVSEEEDDFSKIEIRDDFYKAIVRGYLDEMKDELTQKEKMLFSFAGKYMIYMQAIRFLTDYLDGDRYYPIKYPEHNFIRAANQVQLLYLFSQQEAALIKYNS